VGNCEYFYHHQSLIDDLCRAKYPLATVSRLLEVLPKGLGLGYDIACSFTGTLSRSCLGSKTQEQGLRLVVPAFHGHAHNRLCQLSYHIMMSDGFGLEDLETCERVFSASNAVARLTRHASPFHRHQYIDMHFHQWDSEKYENLGKPFAHFATIF
jgi:Kyakuja-Dileera-Zisupton transposase